MKTIRWGIIGCGDVTEVKSGPGFQKATNSSLVAVMRRSGHLAEDYAKRHGVPKWYDDGTALINDPEVDAVYIATPPYAHHEYTLLCAQAGKPVYVEKPMALTFAECQEMIDACRSTGVSLFVAYYRRALARFIKIKELLEQGTIGQPRAVTITLYRRPEPEDYAPDKLHWHFKPALSGGGRFVDVGCHTLDFLDYVLGPLVSVQGLAANQGGYYPAEDVVSAAFTFESGVLGSGTWCFTSFHDEDRTEIVGTKGTLSFSSFDDAPLQLTTAQGISEIKIPFPAHVHQPLIQTIVDELNGVGYCPSTGVSGARTNWVIDQILRNYYRDEARMAS